MRRFATGIGRIPLEESAEKAAQLIADGRLTRQEIATTVGISRSTLYRMAKTPLFRARVNQILDDYRKELRREMRAEWRAEWRADVRNVRR
jgi:DNA invertase Pin-like site-specific DNA recombinase